MHNDSLNRSPAMAAEIALRRHVAQILRNDSALASLIDGIEDSAARAASGCRLILSIAETRDWSGGGFLGREVALIISLQDDARDDDRLGAALAAIDAALADSEPDMPGWRIINVQGQARRILRGSDALWRAQSRYRVRMIAQDF